MLSLCSLAYAEEPTNPQPAWAIGSWDPPDPDEDAKMQQETERKKAESRIRAAQFRENLARIKLYIRRTIRNIEDVYAQIEDLINDRACHGAESAIRQAQGWIETYQKLRRETAESATCQGNACAEDLADLDEEIHALETVITQLSQEVCSQ